MSRLGHHQAQQLVDRVPATGLQHWSQLQHRDKSLVQEALSS